MTDEINWSTELLYKLSCLTAKQRTAIQMIVAAEATRIPISRLLKTSYSCAWCGQQLGRTGDSADIRKQRKQLHEADCRTKSRRFYWTFACTESTYYYKWLKDPLFVDTLDLARQEMVENSLNTAARLMQIGTAGAARELLRQIAEGERDLDKRAAAVAVLDRADVLTASKGKTDEELRDWLAELRQQQGADSG